MSRPDPMNHLARAVLALLLTCFLARPGLAMDLPQAPGAAGKSPPTSKPAAPARPAAAPKREAEETQGRAERRSALPPLPVPTDRSPQAEYAAVKALLEQFLAPGADTVALTRRLRPASADYAVFFGQQAALRARDWYEPFWELGQMLIRPRSKQTRVLVYQALTDELRADGSASRVFPPLWRDVAKRLRAGRLVYAFKFVPPDSSKGVGYDGLTCIDRRFVFFPKPWKALGK